MTAQRFVRLLALCALAFAASFGGAVLAQSRESLTLEERREIVRTLPDDERTRLRDALRRFRDLPPEKQEALRAKAETVGAERLRHLAGRNVAALKGRHEQLDREVDRVLALIPAERLATLGPSERAYLRAEAMRGFQRHVKRKILGFGNYELMEREWDAMTPAERRERLDRGLRALEDAMLSRVPQAEADRVRSLPPRERRAARAETLAQFRMDETMEYARVFDRWRVEEVLRWAPPEREKRIARWQQRAKWFEAARVLRNEIGLDEASLRQLAPLPADALARVVFEVRQTEEQGLAPDARRARIADLVGRIAGEHAVSGPDAPRPGGPLGRLLRERREPKR